MTVKELCSNYDLKFQTVYKKISQHKDNELAGHITKVKGVRGAVLTPPPKKKFFDRFHLGR